MAIKKILLFMATCLIVICQSCLSKNNHDEYSKVPIHYPGPNKMYDRDSFYLAYTIYQFQTLNIVGYGYYFQRADIDTIVYSPDTLKLVAFVIDSFMDYTEKEQTPVYDGHTMLGYRLKTTDPWIIYPFERYIIFAGYRNYNMIRDKLREAYFQNLKDYALYFWNCQQKKFEDYSFKYNLTDPKFWDSCIIWKKDISIPGYYQFQLTGNGDPEMPRNIIKIPEIHYPDSLLKLYHDNKW